MEEKEKQNSFKRNLTGFTIGIIAAICIFFGGIFLLGLLLIVILVASKEYAHILKVKGFHPSFSIMAFVGVLLCLATAINRLDLIPAILTTGTIFSFLIVLFMGRQPYIANVATTAMGFMYGALLPCHIILIRQIEISSNSSNFLIYEPSEGFFLTMFTFLCILVTDTAAYFFGSRYGKHKLSAVISPKKTVEGAVAGSLLSILFSLTGVLYTSLNWWECIIAGLLITISAQLGDLSESLIKRDAGVKDSSNILPGHGGFLDRTDSYIFALPVAYYYFVNFTHGNNFISDFILYIKSMVNVNIIWPQKGIKFI